MARSMVTVEAIEKELEKVVDPEIGLPITEMHLVDEISIQDNGSSTDTPWPRRLTRELTPVTLLRPPSRRRQPRQKHKSARTSIHQILLGEYLSHDVVEESSEQTSQDWSDDVDP